MKQIWAPWRMEYISSQNRNAGCFLCDLLKQAPEKDRENLVLIRSSLAFVVMNLYPYSNGHLMVVPNRHVAEFEDISMEEWQDVVMLTSRSISALKKAFGPHGFNVGLNLGRAAGAGVEGHLHQHIVPRWFGDTNFMPVLAETKVISEHLRETYDRLKPFFL